MQRSGRKKGDVSSTTASSSTMSSFTAILLPLTRFLSRSQPADNKFPPVKQTVVVNVSTNPVRDEKIKVRQRRLQSVGPMTVVQSSGSPSRSGISPQRRSRNGTTSPGDDVSPLRTQGSSSTLVASGMQSIGKKKINPTECTSEGSPCKFITAPEVRKPVSKGIVQTTFSARGDKMVSAESQGIPIFSSATVAQGTTPSAIISGQRDASICNTNKQVNSLATSSATKLCCDKCDGPHETDNCPYFKKKREDHPDACRGNKAMGGTSLLPGAQIAGHEARVIRQPGDGSCLFHSMSYGLGDGTNATRLRADICAFISNNPSLMISDSPLKDWVKWDAGTSVGDYIRKMSRGSWGGGIEMACLSQMKQVNVHVYEQIGSGYKRISAFDFPLDSQSKPIIRVLYRGGVHYG
jgi:hypothetical protein